MRNKIKKVIKDMGTVSEFSEKHGIRQATISDFLSGKQNIGVKTLEKILEACNLEVGKSFEQGKIESVDSIKIGADTYYTPGTNIRIYGTIIYKDMTASTHSITHCFESENMRAVIVRNLKTDKHELLIL